MEPDEDRKVREDLQEGGGVRLLIVDDHSLVSETLEFAIRDSWGIGVSCVSSLSSALDRIKKDGAFDLILLDYHLPEVNGFDALRQLLEANCGRVALFSGVAPPFIIERAIEMGAVGFVPKSIHLPALRHAVNLMIFGEVFVPASLKIGALKRSDVVLELKPRELGVLRLICEGLQNKEIAAELSVPVTSVAVDVKSFCRKLGVSNRTQIVIESQKLGLV